MQVAAPQAAYVPYAPGTPQPATVHAQAVIAALPSQHEVGFTPRRQKAMRILSAMQIAIGISCVIVYIVLLSIKERKGNGYYDRHGAGLWCGGMFIISGSLGLAAARQNRLSLIVSTMIFSIFSSILLWVVLSFGAVAIDQSVRNDDYRCWGYYSYQSYCYTGYNFTGFKAADSILIILSIAEFIVAVWSAVLCCKGSCRACCRCCCYENGYGYQASQAVYYAPAHAAGPQVIVVPHAGIVGSQAIGIVSSQPGSYGQPVLFAHPAGPMAAAAPGFSPYVVARPPEYSSLLVENTVPSGAASGHSGEPDKAQLAGGY